MNIAWVAFGAVERRGVDWYSAAASTRYRVLLPRRQLMAHGHAVEVFAAQEMQAIEHAIESGSAEVLIFSKSTYPEHADLVQLAHRKHCKVIFDLCDNRFLREDRAHTIWMAGAADAVTVSTSALAEVIRTETGRAAIVIGDPIEGERGLPVWQPQDRLHLLWFGQPENLPPLLAEAPRLLAYANQHPLELRIVTKVIPSAVNDASRFNQQYGPTMRIEFLSWSPEMTWQQLSWSDLALLPSDPADPMCATKSPNRLIEALWSGRFVVASPLPSYREFEAWAWVGGDLVAGIEWAYQHPNEIVSRIAEAQHHIEANYSPSAIGARWQQMLESALH